jgi:Mg-chelatase subunit ChlD
MQERPDLFIDSVAHQFRDFWIAKTGTGATKLDWQATWRNWVRNHRQARPNPADIGRVTVPSRQERDPVLVALDASRAASKPPPPEIIEKLRQTRLIK